MKIISQVYNNSKNEITDTTDGRINAGFIIEDNDYYVGTHFISDIETGISAGLVDTIYKQDASFEYKRDTDKRVGLYFYMTDQDVGFLLNNRYNSVGLLNYNLSIIDLGLSTEYQIKKDTRVYCIGIFFEKPLLKKYFKTVLPLDSDVESLFDDPENLNIHWDRMSSNSWNLIDNFKKIDYDNPLYDLFFKGLIYELISNYLEELTLKKHRFHREINSDDKNIITTKLMMVEMVEENFPGIQFLASEVSMSATKYKGLFTKMTGLSPGVFFATKKLHRAKELLESSEFTINEISDKLKYYSVSYFAKCFKKEFGLYPKEYQSQF